MMISFITIKMNDAIKINVINDVIIYKQSDYLSEMLHQKLMMLE